MNKAEYDILLLINEYGYCTQRWLAKKTGLSLGKISKTIKNLKKLGLMDLNNLITKKSKNLILKRKPKNAIILAAGHGMRMVPINYILPKGLIEIKNEKIIERIIKQLYEVNITDITIVVGFEKERFEYLIDEYGVKLVINDDYKIKNNLYSLSLVLDKINNTYIIPSDIWSKNNPFNENELYSWYMITNSKDLNSNIRTNKKMELVKIEDNEKGNKAIGISYITEDINKDIINRVNSMSNNSRYYDSFWEEALYNNKKLMVYPRIENDKLVTEINTYEELRELDSDSNSLNSDAIDVIVEQLNCNKEDIVDINVLKKGMTNRSFIFTVNKKQYIMRIPGEGTNQLINRKEEKEVYDIISGMMFCDNPVYINQDNGYKITRYIKNVRCCNPNDIDDIRKCMKKLKKFHNKKLKVNHVFDIYEKINFYESLWNGENSVYKDYKKTRENVFKLSNYVEKNKKEFQLTHIDSVPDNFLFDPNVKGELSIQLTDWEYAAMQDPHVDIAMFIIYSLYDKEYADRLIDIYFEDEGGCDKKTRTKIYCYISMCGLLWSNWCEYKRQLGVEFGEYSLKQYRYAKDYYEYATELMDEEKCQ